MKSKRYKDLYDEFLKGEIKGLELLYFRGVKEKEVKLYEVKEMMDSSITFKENLSNSYLNCLEIGVESLLEYRKDTVKIYHPALRPLTETEEKVIKGWKEITKGEEYAKKLEEELVTGVNKVEEMWYNYFKNSAAPYIALNINKFFELHYDPQSKCMYDPQSKCMCDPSIKGECLYVFRVVRNNMVNEEV